MYISGGIPERMKKPNDLENSFSETVAENFPKFGEGYGH